MMKITREEISLLRSAVEFFMENTSPFDDEDRIECESVIDKLIKEAAKSEPIIWQHYLIALIIGWLTGDLLTLGYYLITK